MKRLLSLTLGSLLMGSAVAQVEPKLKPDLSNVVNFSRSNKAYQLTPKHLAALQKNQFFISPTDSEQLYHVYGVNDYENFPSLVTTDNVLQLYHVVFDSTLRHLEERHLFRELRKIDDLMLKQAKVRYRKVTGTNLSAAALNNIAYFGVVDRLLGGNSALPADAAVKVAKEVALIQGARGPGDSAIFPYGIDYSQFIVRGHYSRSPSLGRYFKALMWFGLVPLSLEKKSPSGRVPNIEVTRQAALMVQDLYDSGAITAWNRIYSVTSMYVGNSNDMTPEQWRAAAKPVLGWPQSFDKLKSAAGVGELVAAIKKASHPQIVNKAHNSTGVGDVQFRFMGQRAIPDSVVFNRLTGDKREWPSPLDVAIAFGSKRAAEIVDASPANYNPKAWNGYKEERGKIVSEISRWTSGQWNSNLYNGCLDLIHLNLGVPDPRAPKFMQSAAWADKSISSSLAFWAEVRHDTILYGMQTSAEMGDGDDQPYVRGYVEPNVPLYSRLISLLRQTQEGLSGFRYLNDEEIKQFHDFRELLGFLVSVSRRELAGGKISKEEHGRIRRIEGDLSTITERIQLTGESYNTLSEDDLDMALVADVHTVRGQALTVASGHSDDLMAIVPIEGKLYLARGSVLSFYEFKVPISERMTDHVWKQRLKENKAPPRPTWISSYFVNKSSRGKE